MRWWVSLTIFASSFAWSNRFIEPPDCYGDDCSYGTGTSLSGELGLLLGVIMLGPAIIAILKREPSLILPGLFLLPIPGCLGVILLANGSDIGYAFLVAYVCWVYQWFRHG
jgi:hypothetical protein